MISVLHTSKQKATLKIFGDLDTIAEGKLNAERMTLIDSKQFRFALGGGSFSNEKRYGEAIVLSGKPCVSWFEAGKLHTTAKGHFYSPFLMGVEESQQFGALLHCKPPAPLPLEGIYEELAKQYPQGFALVGYAMAAEFQGRYIKKPPIYQENMGQHLSSYLTDPCLEKQKAFCFFGVVIPPQSTFADHLLRKAFYRDPQQPRSSILQSHTHAALLEPAPAKNFPNNEKAFLSLLEKPAISSVAHLLTQSLIQEAVLGLYILDKII